MSVRASANDLPTSFSEIATGWSTSKPFTLPLQALTVSTVGSSLQQNMKNSYLRAALTTCKCTPLSNTSEEPKKTSENEILANTFSPTPITSPTTGKRRQNRQPGVFFRPFSPGFAKIIYEVSETWVNAFGEGDNDRALPDSESVLSHGPRLGHRES